MLDGDDGVDTNRNWAEKWRYDQEGASDDFDSDTYRGTSAQSEPEVSSLDAMFGKLKPKFLLDYHSYGPLILYPEGWQVETQSTDTPATEALAGLDDDHPAITNFDPDVSGELYTTNGDVTGHVYNRYGSLAYTVELEAGTGPASAARATAPTRSCPAASSSRTPRPRSRSSSSATCRSRSTSRARPRTRAARSRTSATWRRTSSPATFKVSYGDPQIVEVNANRDLGPVEAHWRVNGGAEQYARHDRVQGRRALRPARRLLPQDARQRSPASRAGDSVEVWFTAGAKSSASFTFKAEKSTANSVLIMAAEDYSGNTNLLRARARGPAPSS